jgi:hypothetical protein
MVSFALEGSDVVMTVRGFDKILALKSSVRFDRNNIRRLAVAQEGVYPTGIRWPGTSAGGLVQAGTFVGDGRREFWLRRQGNQAIEIDLENEEYTKIVVDVEDLEEIMNAIRSR